MKNQVITISRQYGSYGKIVGEALSEKLHIPCYDKEIIEEISRKSGFSENFIYQQEKQVNKKSFFGTLAGFDLYEYSNKIAIWNEQCKIIKNIAEKESCVIVGRCADFVLRNEDVDLIKVYIYATDETRIDRVKEQYDNSTEIASKAIKQNDLSKSQYYQMYTDQKFGDIETHDICLNTSLLTIDECVSAIEGLVKGKRNG